MTPNSVCTHDYCYFSVQVRAQADEMIIPLWPGFGPPVVGGTSMSHLITMVPVTYLPEEAKPDLSHSLSRSLVMYRTS